VFGNVIILINHIKLNVSVNAKACIRLLTIERYADIDVSVFEDQQ